MGFAHALPLKQNPIITGVAEATRFCLCFQGRTPWLKPNDSVVWQIWNTQGQGWTLPAYLGVIENHHFLSHREERAMAKRKGNPWSHLHTVVSVLAVSWEIISLPRKEPSGDGMSYCPLTFTVSISGQTEGYALKSSTVFFSQWWQSLLWNVTYPYKLAALTLSQTHNIKSASEWCLSDISQMTTTQNLAYLDWNTLFSDMGPCLFNTGMIGFIVILVLIPFPLIPWFNMK